MSPDPERQRALIDANMAAGQFLADVREGKREAPDEAIRLAEKICANGLGSQRARAWAEAMEKPVFAYQRGEIDDEAYEEVVAPLLAEAEAMDAAIEEAAAELVDVLAAEREQR